MDSDVEHCRELLRVAGHRVLVYRSYPLGSPNPNIVRAVIVVHGASRTANSYFRYALDSARAAGHLGDTLIVAPKFTEQSEMGSERWGDDWSSGGNSKSGHVSSFDVVDRLYQGISSRFAAVTTIVVAGHSAGGQFVNRYAAAGRGPDQANGVSSRFLVLNPSSYLYLDDRRFFKGSFEPVAGRAWVCPAFNNFKYGLEHLNDYAEAVGESQMTTQLVTRNVTYLAGSLDVLTDNKLDQRCQAKLQGANRLSRWGIYSGYVQAFPDVRWRRNSQFDTVDGVGHSASEMLKSTEARAVLFP